MEIAGWEEAWPPTPVGEALDNDETLVIHALSIFETKVVVSTFISVRKMQRRKKKWLRTTELRDVFFRLRGVIDVRWYLHICIFQSVTWFPSKTVSIYLCKYVVQRMLWELGGSFSNLVKVLYVLSCSSGLNPAVLLFLHGAVSNGSREYASKESTSDVPLVMKDGHPKRFYERLTP